MRRHCGILLLLLALLTVSRSAPQGQGKGSLALFAQEMQKFITSKGGTQNVSYKDFQDFLETEGFSPDKLTYEDFENLLKGMSGKEPASEGPTSDFDVAVSETDPTSPSDPGTVATEGDDKPNTVSVGNNTEGKSLPTEAPTRAVPRDKDIAVKPSTKTLSLAKSIHKLKPVFDRMPLDKLQLLNEFTSPDKAEQFEGLMEELYDGDDNVEVLAVIDSLKNNFRIIAAMLEGAILKKGGKPQRAKTVSGVKGNSQTVPPQPDEGRAPTQGQTTANGKQQAAMRTGQATSNNNQQVTVIDNSAEKIVLKELMGALKDIPSVDLKRVLVTLAYDDDVTAVKVILTHLNVPFPKLTEDLISFATSHPTDLKYSVEEILEEREKSDAVIVTSSVGKNRSFKPQTDEPPTPTPIIAETTVKPRDQDDLPGDQEETDHRPPPDMMDKLDQEEVAQAKDENDLDLVPPKDENDPVMIFPDLVDGLSKSDWGRPNDDSLDKDDDWANLPDNNNNDVNLKPVKAGGDKKPEVFQPPVIGQSAPDKPSSSGGGGWFGMWHFLIIFLLIAGVVGVVYLCSHNRKRLRDGVGGYLGDITSRGRRSRNYRYKPLSST